MAMAEGRAVGATSAEVREVEDLDCKGGAATVGVAAAEGNLAAAIHGTAGAASAASREEEGLVREGVAAGDEDRDNRNGKDGHLQSWKGEDLDSKRATSSDEELENPKGGAASTTGLAASDGMAIAEGEAVGATSSAAREVEDLDCKGGAATVGVAVAEGDPAAAIHGTAGAALAASREEEGLVRECVAAGDEDRDNRYGKDGHLESWKGGGLNEAGKGDNLDAKRAAASEDELNDRKGGKVDDLEEKHMVSETEVAGNEDDRLQNGKRKGDGLVGEQEEAVKEVDQLQNGKHIENGKGMGDGKEEAGKETDEVVVSTPANSKKNHSATKQKKERLLEVELSAATVQKLASAFDEMLNIREESAQLHRRQEKAREREEVLALQEVALQLKQQQEAESAQLRRRQEKACEREEVLALREVALQLKQREEAVHRREQALNGYRQHQADGKDTVIAVGYDPSPPILLRLPKQDDTWDRRQIVYVFALGISLGLFFPLIPFLPSAYFQQVLFVFVVIWGLGSIGFPMGLFSTAPLETCFSRHVGRLVFMAFSLMVVYMVYIVAESFDHDSRIAPPSSSYDRGLSTSWLDISLLEIGYIFVAAVVFVGQAYSWVRGWWTDIDKDPDKSEYTQYLISKDLLQRLLDDRL